MIRSTETVADVALVPEGDVFQRGHGVAAQDARQAGQAFAGDGIALVRHGAGTFLARREKFLRLQHFGALQMAEFRRPAFDARADQRQDADEFRVQIALDDLRGDGRRAQAQFLADAGFHPRRKMRAGADGAGKFAHRHAFRARVSSRCKRAA